VTLLEAVILGIVQGLTEPLPVSSSAHLVIVPALIPGFRQPSVFFDVILHVGTLFAVVFFLRREITDILASLMPAQWSAGSRTVDGGKGRSHRRIALLIVAATAVTGTIGVLFKDRIESLFESVERTAAMLLVTGMLLFLSDRVKKPQRHQDSMNLADGIILGLVQAAALIPGISRSGSTIAFGIFRGLERKTAATFSFLLSVPAIAGAALLKAADITVLSAGDLPALGAGFLAAAVTGFLALKLLFAMINRTGLSVFAYYCWFVGAATLIVRGMQP
jgi:undecaprenyl-diphosphatase